MLSNYVALCLCPCFSPSLPLSLIFVYVCQARTHQKWTMTNFDRLITWHFVDFLITHRVHRSKNSFIFSFFCETSNCIAYLLFTTCRSLWTVHRFIFFRGKGCLSFHISTFLFVILWWRWSFFSQTKRMFRIPLTLFKSYFRTNSIFNR